MTNENEPQERMERDLNFEAIAMFAQITTALMSRAKAFMAYAGDERGMRLDAKARAVKHAAHDLRGFAGLLDEFEERVRTTTDE